MCVRIIICACIWLCVCTCICVCVCTCMCVCMYMYTCKCIYIHVRVYTCVCVRTHVSVCIRVCVPIHTHTHVSVCTCVCARINTHIPCTGDACKATLLLFPPPFPSPRAPVLPEVGIWRHGVKRRAFLPTVCAVSSGSEGEGASKYAGRLRRSGEPLHKNPQKSVL